MEDTWGLDCRLFSLDNSYYEVAQAPQPVSEMEGESLSLVRLKVGN